MTLSQNVLKLLYFSDVEKFEDNAKVITSGLGGKAPKGIYIGTVESSIVSEDGNIQKQLELSRQQILMICHMLR